MSYVEVWIRKKKKTTSQWNQTYWIPWSSNPWYIGISKIECCTRSIYGVIRYLHQKFQVSKMQVLNHTSLLLSYYWFSYLHFKVPVIFGEIWQVFPQIITTRIGWPCCNFQPKNGPVHDKGSPMIIASQPTPPNVPPSETRPYYGLIKHWFPLLWPY